MRPAFPIALAAAALAAIPAAATLSSPVPVAEFRAIDLQGGGTVRLRHAPVQRVTLVSGSMEHARIEVVQSSLRLSPCVQRCPPNQRFEVMVESPGVTALAVTGGGTITVEGNFPRQPNLAAAVTGGGRIDARAIPAGSIAAAVRGGGGIVAGPSSSLAASINGGGSIQYAGDPTVTSAINGGGTVRRIR